MKAIVYSSIIILLSIVTSYADYHYASHEGSNEYPYTSWETAADSIQKAVDAAESGDTVYVGEGTYVENLIMKDTLALIGMGWENTTIDGMSYANEDWAVIFAARDNLIKDLTVYGRYFRYPDNNGAGGISGMNGDRGLIVKNCLIHDCDDGIHVYGYCVVENCILENNYTFNVFLFAGGVQLVNNTFHQTVWGQYNLELWDGDLGIEIRNNIIESPENHYGSAGKIAYSDSGLLSNNLFIGSQVHQLHTLIFAIADGVFTFENNTIFGEGIMNDGIRFNYRYGPSIYTLRNNIITGLTAVGTKADEQCSVSVHHNLIYDVMVPFEGTGIDTSEGGNIYVDPMFADPIDFELEMFSPAIDAGDPDILDVDGTRSDMGYLGGPFGRSYEYQDLPPEIPINLSAEVINDTIVINWDYATEADFGYYNIYRQTYSGFTPSHSNLTASPDTSLYYDTDWSPENNYYYLITAIDNQDNESEPSEELAVLTSGLPDDPNNNLPKIYTLEQNYPNPFNPQTTIKYYIPNVGAQPAQVELVIYNVLGKEVRKLVDKRQYPGEYRVVWDGTDEGGNDVSSGVYFYQLKIWGIEIIKPKKMVLMR